MEPQDLTPTTTVQRRADVLEASVDDDLILLSLEEGAYFGAGPTGRAIWQHLEKQITVEQLLEQLLEQFEVERDVCREQTLRFLVELEAANLLHVA